MRYKSFFSIILAVCLIVGTISIPATAADGDLVAPCFIYITDVSGTLSISSSGIATCSAYNPGCQRKTDNGASAVQRRLEHHKNMDGHNQTLHHDINLFRGPGIQLSGGGHH